MSYQSLKNQFNKLKSKLVGETVEEGGKLANIARVMNTAGHKCTDNPKDIDVVGKSNHQAIEMILEQMEYIQENYNEEKSLASPQ